MYVKRLGYRTLHGMVWGYIGKLLEFILAFTFSIVIARQLGPSLYGSYNLFINVITTLIIFTSFGQESILNKYIPQLNAQGKVDSAFGLFRSALITRLTFFSILGIFFYIFSSFLARIFSDNNLIYFSFLFALLFLVKGLQQVLLSFFNALLKLKHSAMVNTFSQATGIAFVLILFLRFGHSLGAALQVVVLYNTLAVFLFLFLAWNALKGRYNYKLLFSKPYWNFGLSIWQVSILTYCISTTLNILLMGKILNDPQQIGFYSTAILFTYLPGNLISSWAGVILPSMSEVKEKYGNEGVSYAFVSFSKLILVLLIPVLVFLGWYAKPLVVNMFTDKFLPAAGLIQIFVCFNLVAVLASPHAGVNTLYALDKEKLVLKFRFLAGLINIALVFLLTSTYKAAGAMIAGLIAIAFQTFAEFFIVKKNVKFKYPYLYLMKVFFAAVLGIFIVSLLPVNSVFAIILAGLIYSAVLLIVFHYIRLLSAQDKEFLNSLHPIFITITKHF